MAHRWAMVAIAKIDETRGGELAAMGMLDRLDNLCALFSPPPGRLSDVWAVRGPLCADCRVTWEDVHAQPDKPWPCPGKRPDDLGGPLTNPTQSRPARNRQERRQRRRQAEKRSK